MNKSDTISKEYLLAEIDDLADEFSEIDENGLHSERWCGIMDAKQIIINTPFMSDRPQGKWIEMYRNGFGNMICMCSKCNFHATKSIFCPNCGAKMKGADDETAMS